MWAFRVGFTMDCEFAIGADDTVYATADNLVYAIRDGEQLWNYTDDFYYNLFSSPAIAADGTLIVAHGTYIVVVDGANGMRRCAVPFHNSSLNYAIDGVYYLLVDAAARVYFCAGGSGGSSSIVVAVSSSTCSVVFKVERPGRCQYVRKDTNFAPGPAPAMTAKGELLLSTSTGGVWATYGAPSSTSTASSSPRSSPSSASSPSGSGGPSNVGAGATTPAVAGGAAFGGFAAGVVLSAGLYYLTIVRTRSRSPLVKNAKAAGVGPDSMGDTPSSDTAIIGNPAFRTG